MNRVATIVLSVFLSSSAAAQTLTVNSTVDPGNGTCDVSECTLREAIATSNASVGVKESIAFNIPGAGPHTIQPLSALPEITDPVVIDGSTQPGAQCGTWPPSQLIELDGSSAGGGVNGLKISAGDSRIVGLVINRFGGAGIHVLTNGGNTLMCNYLGTNVGATAALPNGAQGLLLSNSANNMIGGSNQYAGSVFSGNESDGVEIFGPGSTGNTIQASFIGLDVTGTNELHNSGNGVRITEAADNMIGIPNAAAQSGLANIISGNWGSGVFVGGTGATDNVITGNLIGLDRSGSAAVQNQINGVTLTHGGNTVGSAAEQDGNLISGNRKNGISIDDPLGTGLGNVVIGNVIGLDIDGLTTVKNQRTGILVRGPDNVIGGLTNGESNVISGNGQYGIYTGGPNADANQILGNYIGLDVTLTQARPNVSGGITIAGGVNNIIGGAPDGAGNVISGNTLHGIWLLGQTDSVTGAQVLGNYIGVDDSGDATVGNGRFGISLMLASGVTIGGTSPDVMNVISGNGWGGVSIEFDTSTDNRILGNYIGTNFDATANLGNTGPGILIAKGAHGNTVGGTAVGTGNLISGNTGNGISLIDVSSEGTANNTIQGNSIFNNGGLGIDIDDDGVTTNDAGDADSGTNGLQNFPVLTGAATGSSVTVDGTLNSTASTTFRLEFFSSSVLDPSTYGEGESYIGSTNVTTDPGGNAPFSITLPWNAGLGRFLTTTATDPFGNTSEFSAGFTITDPLLVTTTADTGPGSLRSAMEFANSHTNSGGPDEITFAIPGPGPHTIQPLSALPEITDPAVIDGSTQPGASCAAWPPTLMIELDGTLGPSSIDGLFITAGGSTVKGLVINRFDGDGIYALNGGGNTISCNFIGTNVAGTARRPNDDDGIDITNSSDNTIGGSTWGSGNLISGNAADGLEIFGAGSRENLVLGNRIGTDVTGTSALLNEDDGIYITSAPDNTIGGPTEQEANLISGNDDSGISIEDDGATGNRIIGNKIGTDISGTTDIENNEGIVLVYGGNTVGGTAPGEGNLISGNDFDGIDIADPLVSNLGNQIIGNIIGLDITGTSLLPNGSDGIYVYDAPNNIIGGSSPGARNVISGNFFSGVRIAGPNSRSFGTRILGNYIGPDVTGTAKPGMQNNGVVVWQGSTNNTVGGSESGEGNLISGNLKNGILLGSWQGTATGNNSVQGNFIGVNADGTGALGNDENGILISTPGNTIGGATPGDRNVISGNGINGMLLEPGADNNLIRGNYIGTNASGTAALGNGVIGPFGDGIEMHGVTGNIIGGTSPGEGNLVSGNLKEGVFIWGGATGTSVQGNYIGTDVTGFTAIPNTEEGVDVRETTGNIIGGTVPGARNVLSGNGQSGIEIAGWGAALPIGDCNTVTPGASSFGNTLVHGNYIGVAADGSTPLPNVEHGLEIEYVADNMIGGTGSGTGNIIAHNTLSGIFNSCGSLRTSVQGNSIYANGGLGIDIEGDGVTANDDDDPDGGTNNHQNFPVLTAAGAGSSITIEGTLNSTPSTTFRLEFFSNSVLDPTAYGEGENFVGSIDVATDAGGNAVFSGTFPTSVPAGYFVTATATDPTGNTSEFSEGIDVIAVLDPLVVINTSDSGPGSLRGAIEYANGNANVGGPDSITFAIPGPGPHTIQPLSALPEITDPVVIDGSTQPGAQCSSSPPTQLIEVDGSSAGSGTDGLKISAGDSQVTGLVINRFDGAGIHLLTGGGNTVMCNFLGTNVGATAALPNGAQGLLVSNSPDNLIGGSALYAGSVFSGNTSDGVEIFGAGSTGNHVQASFIGLDVTGTNELHNSGNGVRINEAADNIIGIPNVAAQPGLANIISGNSGSGVLVGGPGATDNVITGNLIGLDNTGLAAVGNGVYGVAISYGGNTVGSSAQTVGNLISGNLAGGILISDPLASNLGNQIIGNGIGLDFTLSAPIPNLGDGVSIVDAANNVIGSTTVDEGNVISGNATAGVRVTGNASGNSILGNAVFANGTLGIDLENDGVTGNDEDDLDTGANGIQNFPVLTGAFAGSSVTIDGKLNSTPSDTFRLEFFSNAVSDPSGYGEGETFIGSTDVTTSAGGDASFSITFPNSIPEGAFISATATDPDGSSSEFSMSIEVLAPLLVTNTDDSGSGSLRSAIESANSHPNGGVLDEITFAIPGVGPHTIRPLSQLPEITDPVSMNGLGQPGASCSTWPPTLLIQLDGSGAGTGIDGLSIAAGGSTIRGLFIGGFGGYGIALSENGDNVVACNYIGVDPDGSAVLPNELGGIFVGDAPGNRIGGTSADMHNLISGNVGHGVDLAPGASDNLILGNYIGTDSGGAVSPGLGNGLAGIHVFSSATNTIGGTDAGNTIAGNGGEGVLLIGGKTLLLDNVIFGNGGLGIDLSLNSENGLGDGVTANDTDDTDDGANGLQNYPVLSAAYTGSLTVEGTLNSSASTLFRLDVYSNAICDASGYGEGEQFVGSGSVSTDESGNVNFSIFFGDTMEEVGRYITATATDPDGNTSEFGACIVVEEPAILPPDTPSLTSPDNNAIEQPLAVTLVWSEPTGTEKYHLQAASDTGFGTVVYEDSTLIVASHEIGPLTRNHTYFWRARAGNTGGWSAWSGAFSFTTVTGVTVENESELPETVALLPNYPNPFNPRTTIRYEIPATSRVRLVVYDALGRPVRMLVDRRKAAGRYSVSFDAETLPSGVYIYRMEAGGTVLSRPMMLVK